MANPFRDMGVSDAELTAAIEKSAEVKVEKRKRAKEMVTYAKSISPVDTGEYAASIKVIETKTGKVKVAAMVWYAHFIEYGTGPDKKGSKKKRWRPGAGRALGPDTKTPEFAVMAKTAAQFGGTSDGQAGEGR